MTASAPPQRAGWRPYPDNHPGHRDVRLCRDTGPVKDRLKYYQRMGFAKGNAAGIEATLTRLSDRYNR